MGLHQFNKFLKEYAPDCMRTCNFMYMRNKTIVIDTNLYMHLFKRDKLLIINMFWLITLFKNNKINMIFIFDGAPPPEKRYILQKRRERKEKSYEKIQQLKQSINSKNIDKINGLIKKEMVNAVHVSRNDIETVKSLINACGISYINAEGEADKLCAQLVKDGVADACLSEDMDLVLYGTSQIIRNLDLLNETFTVYNYIDILKQLKLTDYKFKYLCVANGTDYNKRYISIHKAYNMCMDQELNITQFTEDEQSDQTIKNTIDLFNIDVQYTYKLNKGVYNEQKVIDIMKNSNIIYLV